MRRKTYGFRPTISLAVVMATVQFFCGGVAFAGSPVYAADLDKASPNFHLGAVDFREVGRFQDVPTASADDPGSFRFEIKAQQFSLSPGTELSVEAVLDMPADGSLSDSVAVAVSLSPPIQSMASLRSILENEKIPSLRRVAELPVQTPHQNDALGPGPRSIPITYRAAVNAQSPDGQSVSFPATGVYLLRFDVVSGTGSEEVLDSADTFVEFSFSKPAPRLYAALVAPISAPPMRGPLAVASDSERASALSLKEIERLTRLVGTYESASALPLSLAVQPSTLSDLAVGDDSTGTGAGELLASIVHLAQAPGRESLALPFSVLPTQYYSSPALQAELSEQWEMGRSVFQSITAKAATTDVVLPPPGGFDLKALERVGELGFDSAVLRTTDFADQRTLSRVQPLLAEVSAEGALTAYPAFDEVSPALSALDTKTLRLSPAAVAATLVVSAMEAPSPRGALLLPPYAWDPNPEGLSMLLSLLQQTPWLRPVLASELFESVPLALTSRRVRAIARIRPTDSQSSAPQMAEASKDARVALGGLESMTGAQSELASVARSAYWQAPSVVVGAPPTAPPSELAARAESAYLQVSNYIRQIVAGVSIPQAAGVTLTSQSSFIPIRIENGLPQPIDLAVTLQSDKLHFVEGDRLSPVTVPPGGLTLNIPVEAQSTGAFTMHVSLSSPDGKLVLVSQRLEIRFMRVGPVAILLGLTALGVLGFWWISQTLARRRRPAGSSDRLR
jgi:hypothetical protein